MLNERAGVTSIQRGGRRAARRRPAGGGRPPMLSLGLDAGMRWADLTGRQIGAYRLERVLGAGAFGSVYLGRHTHLGVLRAVKVLQASLAAMPELQARFLQEARTAAGLSHPCIVPVHDFGV